MSTTAPWTGRRLHFVGAGGCGMSALALISADLGAEVTGSDRAESRFVAPLRRRGIEVAIGHRAENVPAGAEVVHSAAIPPDNPERVAAAAQVPRGDLLAEVCALRRCVAIAGTHGKTTTAAMTVHALAAGGIRASYVVGALLLDTGVNAAWHDGDWLVVETDESDGSHLAIRPEVAVLTNADHDHVGRYPDIADVRRTFAEFLAPAAKAIVWDRPDETALAPAGFTTFDASAVRIGAERTRFRWRGRDVELSVAGEHNARNAAAALEVCSLLGADLDRAVFALRGFGGTSRRLELRGWSAEGARVYDDYAHHPVAVAATLAALRAQGARRIVAALQPWGLARVAKLWREFGAALDDADEAMIVATVVGGSKPAEFPGVGSHMIADAARASRLGRPVHLTPELTQAEQRVRATLDRDTVFVTLGCGDVHRLATAIVARAPYI